MGRRQATPPIFITQSQTTSRPAGQRINNGVGAFEHYAVGEPAPNTDVQLIVLRAVDTILEGFPIGIERSNTSEVGIDAGAVQDEVIQAGTPKLYRTDTVTGAIVLEEDYRTGAGIDGLVAAIFLDPEKYLQHDLVAVDVDIRRAAHRDIGARTGAHLGIPLYAGPAPDQFYIADFIHP